MLIRDYGEEGFCRVCQNCLRAAEWRRVLVEQGSIVEHLQPLKCVSAPAPWGLATDNVSDKKVRATFRTESEDTECPKFQSLRRLD